MRYSSLVSKDLLILSLAFFFVFMGAGATQQFLIPNLAQRLHMSDRSCSWILGSVYFSGVVWRLLYSYTLHFLGMYTAIVVGLSTYALFVLCALLFKSYVLLLLAAVVWGWGAACIWISSPTQILDATASSKFGSASGIFYSAVFLGQWIGVWLLGTWFKSSGDFEALLRFAIAITFIGNFISLFLPKRHIRAVGSPKLTDVIGLFGSVKSLELAFILFSTSFGFGLLLSSFSSMASQLGLMGNLHQIVSGFYAGRLVSSWSIGSISDKFGREPIMRYILILSAVGLIIAGIFESSYATPYTLFLAALTLGLQAGMLPVVVMGMVGDSTKPQRRHLAFGALHVWSNLGIGITIVGVQYLRLLLGGFRESFFIFALIFLCCAILSFDLERRKSEEF